MKPSMGIDNIEAIIFDFDGVILDSAKIKTEAFLDLFKEYPQHLKAIKDYHIEHQGITRYQKFEWIYKELLNKPYSNKVKERLGQNFTDLVFRKIIDVRPLPGAIQLLETLKKNKMPAFIASGTPDSELHKIINIRELASYFKYIYGSDISKPEAIDKVVTKEDVEYSNIIFVGDAKSDYLSATSRNVPFIAVYSDEMQDYWQSKGVKVVHNLMEIAEDLEFEDIK